MKFLICLILMSLPIGNWTRAAIAAMLLLSLMACASIPSSPSECRSMCGRKGVKTYQAEKESSSSKMQCDCQ